MINNAFEIIYNQANIKVYRITNPEYIIDPEKHPQFKVLKCSLHINNECTSQCRLLQNEFTIHSHFEGSDLVVQQHTFQQNTMIQDEECCCIEMEYFHLGDLADAILEHPQNHKFYQEKLFKSMLYQVLQSVKLMHDKNISVNDIKFDNFFITDMDLEAEEPTISLKIGDLGYAYQENQRTIYEQSQAFCNKLKDIMSPELLQIAMMKPEYIPMNIRNQPGINEKTADLYAVGVMAFQIFTRLPFGVFQRNPQIMMKLLKQKYNEVFRIYRLRPYLEQIKTHCFEKWQEVLDLSIVVLQADPTRRCTIEMLLSHIQN